jgi:hypothetical protein
LRRQLGFAATMPHDIGLDMEVVASAACPWTPDTLYVDLGTHPQTYAWAFPKATHWSIGVKGPAPQGHALAHYLRQFMQRWQRTPTDGKLRYLAHMLPTRMPGTPLVRERALVLGDAAALLERFTGEGIYYALHSAYLAAEAHLRQPASVIRHRGPMRGPSILQSGRTSHRAGPCSRCSMPGPGFFIAWCGPTHAPGRRSPHFCGVSAVFAMSNACYAVSRALVRAALWLRDRGVGEDFAS